MSVTEVAASIEAELYNMLKRNPGEYKQKGMSLSFSLSRAVALCTKLAEGKIQPARLVAMDKSELKAYAANAGAW